MSSYLPLIIVAIIALIVRSSNLGSCNRPCRTAACNLPCLHFSHGRLTNYTPRVQCPRPPSLTLCLVHTSYEFRRMAPSCSIDVPETLTLPVSRPRPHDLEPWTAENITSAMQGSFRNVTFWRMLRPDTRRLRAFVPSQPRSDGWASAIRASQHPLHCKRFLLLEDDMLGSGFGFDGRLMSLAMLIAVAEQRVMLHAPAANATRPYQHFSHVTSGRWCDRPPYTLDCFWKPLSHCQAPAGGVGKTGLKQVEPFRVIRGRTFPRFEGRYWPLAAPVVRLKLSWLHESQLYAGFYSPAAEAATRYIFRPRAWVRQQAECITKWSGLHHRSFIAVFLRRSEEKAAELKSQLPPSAHYEEVTRRAVRALGLQAVFVQSASQMALEDFSRFANRQQLNMTYTQGHPRSEHDTEGGRYAHLAMWHGVVAAINMHIASQAAAFIGLQESMWTLLSVILQRPVAGSGNSWSLSSRCGPRGTRTSITLTPATPVARHMLESDAKLTLPGHLDLQDQDFGDGSATAIPCRFSAKTRCPVVYACGA